MPRHEEKVDEIQAQIDKMRKEYMTHQDLSSAGRNRNAQYINELLERNECLKRVNDEQAAVLTSCQDEYKILSERLTTVTQWHENQARIIQAQENQKRELVRQVQIIGDRNLDLQEDNERMGKVVVNHLGATNVLID